MASTYTPIANQILTNATSTITFSSISGSYTDLILITNGYSGADYYLVRVNNDSGSNYSRVLINASGSSGSSSRASNITEGYGSIGDASTRIGGTIHHFMNYSNTTTYKTFIRRGGAGGLTYSPQAEANLWRSTSAINRIDLITAIGNFAIGSSFTLYGITAA